MPVVKSGNKWEFGGKTYDTEDAANNAYKAYLAMKFGTTDSAKEDKAEGASDNKKEDKAEKKPKSKQSKKK